MVKNFQRTIIFLLKLILFASLFIIFFGLFSIPNWQLLSFSRTAGVTMLTFVVVGLGMIAAYGTYDIGKRKSKPIIYSVSLAVVITDVVTYIQLSIMNVNKDNNETFRLENFELLILVIILQLVFVTFMAYFGNFIYFKMNAPERCCIVTSSQMSLNQAYRSINKYKKQYKVTSIKDYKDLDLKKCILESDTVFLCDVPIKERTELVEFCYRNMRNVYFNPEIADVVEINAKHIILDDVSYILAPVKELSLEQRILKRIMDLILAVVAIVVTSPIWVLAAFSIKMYDGGKVIFKQKRATKDGQVFEVFKFRTMIEGAENYSVTDGDVRITPVGKVLRKIRMDELPQLLNILKGEMSFVGPRPEMLENVYIYTKDLPAFQYRLRVKAGLTGYAQISGKYNTSPRDKLVLDLMYIENYSIWKDIKLILQTLIVFLKSDSTEAFHPEDEVKFVKAEERIGKRK